MTEWEKMEESHITALKEAEEIIEGLAKLWPKMKRDRHFPDLHLHHILGLYQLVKKAHKWREKWTGK